MIHFEWPWLLLCAFLPLLVYWLPAKKKTTPIALKMPLLMADIDASQAHDSSHKAPLLLLTLMRRLIWDHLLFVLL